MPQGQDAGTPNGDFVSDNDAIAITAPYRYFIEVPAGATKLQVDLYDADVGISATEAPLNRDRDRGGYNTTAAYRLFNPAGTAVTPRFTTGTNAAPVGADGNWMVFYSATGNTVADNFTTNVYTRNDGNNNWSTDWTETDIAGGATTGAIQVTGGELRLHDEVAVAPIIYRQADLLGTPGLNMGMAFLTYSYRTSGNLDDPDTVTVQVSANGGGSWTTLVTYANDVTGTASFDITPYIADNTRIRFVVADGQFTGTEFFFVDNVLISDGPVPTAGHWELQVDMTTAGGDDINAVGIRAHDGDITSAGTEFNVYADSMVSLGVNPDGSGGNSKATTLYPWVVSGCTCQHSDFDRDSDGGSVGTQRYTSRLGTYVQTFTSGNLSPDDTWMPNATDNFTSFTNFTSAQLSVDYGIWELLSTINTYINTSGNYETLYLGNYLIGATPPTTNPIVSGGFPATSRLYLPTDGNTAPVKPYLKQVLTAFNGPQPAPAVGVARTYTVTVSVVNPTPHAINFSATNLVISNVPGAGTVYAGPASVSQGGAPTTPVVGGTGNVSWNPGTVIAGGTATMAYNITVTPAGANTNATGTPGSGNGTRATYLDETGNATQARATYRLGGICELRVVVGALTEAMLSSFEADRGHVAWTTASEAGTIGYNLYREDGTKVNDSLIPAGRQKYEIDDRFMAERYYLEEITASGRANRHGPLTKQHRLGPDVEKTPDRPMKRMAAAEASHGIGAEAAKTSAVMVGVRETGIVRVPFTELATRFGKPMANIANSAEKGSFSVKTGGKTVAFTSTSDALLFFGEKSDSIYSNERIYRIDQSKGELMANVAVAASSASLSSFTTQVDAETDAFAATVLPLDPEGDYWFWDYIVSGDASVGRTFTVNAPDVASTNGSTLQVRLQGALAGASHLARVSLNGVPVGEITWSGLEARAEKLLLPAGVLHQGANEVAIEGVLDPSDSFDVFYIDGFNVRYGRYARPVDGSLEANVSAAFSAGPFTSTPILLDVTNRLLPKVLTGAALSSGSLAVALPSTTKTVFASEQFVVPASYRSAVDWAGVQRTDYIVIAPSSMRSGAEALASLRQGPGMRTAVVDLDQIYDQFSNGGTTPHAIRTFIASVLQQSPRPKYVVLAGTGTLDYRGIQQAPGPVPPIMVKTANGLFASDSKMADANNDGVPDLAIGRIPVSTNAELLAYVDKLRNHTAAAADDPIVFTADAIDGGTNFGQASDEAKQYVSTRPKQRFHIDEIGPQATRDGLIGAWTGGTPLVSWVGHGGLDQLASSGVLTAGDAPSLQAAGRLPVLVAMTCTINRFEISGIAEPLGSALTRQSQGGALAVWSATGLSNHENAREMQRTFMRIAAAQPQLRLGEVIMQTLAAHPSDTAGIYVLLGDPAITLDLPKEITNAGTPIPTGE
jgi:hypothetical protein